MIFAHDTELALVSAAALVNTAAWRPDDEDTLSTVADLERFLDEQGWSGVRTGEQAELSAVRDLRPR
ncbi:MAG TPA: ABATE domain-containing protein, partial [Marmoricola sp.]|nr:ABATE domain-containing protein [Marmoricola sp.]